ncbi:hypothetical protein [Siminovitchia sp. FSL W7-1587]
MWLSGYEGGLQNLLFRSENIHGGLNAFWKMGIRIGKEAVQQMAAGFL